MKKIGAFGIILLLAGAAQASWYWPFDSKGEESRDQPRLSELMEPASQLIDEASDLAGDGKTSDAIAKYREALAALDRIEAENPDRVEKPEFASLRNKRAYVTAAIDSMLMAQVRDNAKAVAVSDTTDLEKRLAEERSGKAKKPAAAPAAKETAARPAQAELPVVSKTDRPKAVEAAPVQPKGNREKAMEAMSKGDYETAAVAIEDILVEKPNDAAALNLRAALATAQGRLDAAERDLDQAIAAHPQNYFAYYNMARLLLQKGAEKSSVKRYYETGRTLGGPADGELEAQLK